MEQERLTINIGKMFKIFLIVLVALFIGFVLVFVIKIQVDGRNALRQAKNVKLALRAADIQMYGKGTSIYDPSERYGLREGADEKVNELYTPQGKYRITSYDSKKHELTGFIYEVGRYTVTYDQDGNKVKWDVDIRYNIYSFREDIVNDE